MAGDGSRSCSGVAPDAGPPLFDAGAPVHWPSQPVSIPSTALVGKQVTGLRVVDPASVPNGSSQTKLLYIFFNDQLQYLTAQPSQGSCPGGIAAPTLSMMQSGTVYDANSINLNSVNYAYTVYQNMPAPPTMSLSMVRSPGATVSVVSFGVATTPGLSYVDLPPQMDRTPIVSVVAPKTFTLHIGTIDLNGNLLLPGIGLSVDTTSSSIRQVAHADFNGDGWPDYVFTGMSRAAAGRWACISDPSGNYTSKSMQTLADSDPTVSQTELLAVADFMTTGKADRKLVRVVGGTAVTASLSDLVPMNSTPPYKLQLVAPAISTSLTSYLPQFVATLSVENGSAVEIFIAASTTGSSTGSLIGLKVDAQGHLLASTVELLLPGAPAAMVVGNYP
jgi:hypothetical protein